MTHRGVEGKYSPAPMMQAGAWYVAPFPGPVSIKTGIAYSRKGYTMQTEFRHDSSVISIYESRTAFHYLHIPLMITVRLWEMGKQAVSAGGGMSYGFLMKAHTNMEQRVYENGELFYTQKYPINHRVAFLPPDDLPPAGLGSANFYQFQPAVNAEVLFTMRDRYILRAFYEYHLYDATINQVTGGALNLHAAGLSIGIGFGGKPRVSTAPAATGTIFAAPE